MSAVLSASYSYCLILALVPSPRTLSLPSCSLDFACIPFWPQAATVVFFPWENKNIKTILIMCVCVWMCACECRYPRRPEEGVESPGAGITGTCETANVGPGNQIGSSETAIHGFKHPIISSTLPPTLNLLCRKDKLELPVILPLPLESRILCVHHHARSLAQGLERLVNTLVGAAPSPAVLFIYHRSHQSTP